MATRKPKVDKQPPSARDRALGLLSRREHSTRELKLKLAQRGYAADDRDTAVEALTRAKYQSDERFAEVLIRTRAAAGYGPRYIEAELRSHGIAPATHRTALDDNDWIANATALVRRRYAGKLGDRDARNKAAQFLIRRGFSSSAVKAATGVEPPD